MNPAMTAVSYLDYFSGFWIFRVIASAIVGKTKKTAKWWAFAPLFLAALIIEVNYAAIVLIPLIILIDISIGQTIPAEIYKMIGTI